ncbi:MAG: hypothetical protein NVS3B16_14770 [Vulcanimicrobiaceae bacterium]
MQKIRRFGLGAAFATATTASMLLGAATTTQQAGTLGGYAAQIALADEDEEHGSHDCNNPAGHERGWCDHEGEGPKRHKHHKHHRNDDGGYGSRATLSGTVQNIDGNAATLRLDDGRTVNVDTGGTPLNIGQHYTLDGCYRNDVFVVNCSGSQDRGGHAQQQVSGTILSVTADTVTLVGLPPVRIDISRARQNNAISTSLALATHITAYGYYQNGTFFATRIR